MSQSDWMPVEPDVSTACSRFERPLEELAAGRIPALVVRQAWSAENCRELVQRLIDEELLYDPDLPIPPLFQKQSIPEGTHSLHTVRKRTRCSIGCLQSILTQFVCSTIHWKPSPSISQL